MNRAVIVGGGVIGSMHAWLALGRGYEVVQLERELDARGASIRNFGLVWVSGRRPGAELAFALRSRALWEELAGELPELGFRGNGSLTIVQHESELRVLEEVVARADAVDRQFALLDAAEVMSLNPAIGGEVLAGLHCRVDAVVEPSRVPRAIQAAMARDDRYTWLPGRHVVEVGSEEAYICKRGHLKGPKRTGGCRNGAPAG